MKKLLHQHAIKDWSEFSEEMFFDYLLTVL